MDQTWVYLQLALQVGFALCAAALCLAICRWSTRLWSPLGMVVGLGLVVRAWAGLALFTISYLNLPILSALHTGDGFWRLAPDARLYYQIAATSGADGSMPANAPSPRFIEVLGVWMSWVGDGLASPLLLNLVLHAAICAMLIASFSPMRDGSNRRAALVTISAFSFSPVLILLGTQTLKDVFFALLVVCGSVGVAELVSAVKGEPRFRSWLLPLSIVTAAVFLIAGVRPYYALFVWGAVALALLVDLLLAGRRTAVRSAARSLVALVLLWGAFMWGAGDYYSHYAEVLSRMTGIHVPHARRVPDARRSVQAEGLDAAFSSIRLARRGFARSGGSTNLAEGELDDGADALVFGLAAVFVPINVLEALSLVELSGRGAFLVIADADTLFTGLSIAAVVWVLVSNGRHRRALLPFLVFGAVLGLVTAVLLGYVVTNYGTLFRLRLLATVPLWTLPLSLAHARRREERELAAATHLALPELERRRIRPRGVA